MAETIQEFFVKLGFKVDRGEESRFTALLGSLAKTAAGISAAMTASAGVIAASVVKISESFDALYFASQRTNATVAGMKSLSYAFQQVGGRAEDATEAIEGIAATLRSNPRGISGYLAKFFHVPTEVEGKARKAEEILLDVAKARKRMEYRQFEMATSNLGLNSTQAQILYYRGDELEKWYAQRQQRRKDLDVDPDKAAESSNKLMTSFRSLMATVDDLSDKIVERLQPILSRWLEKIEKWFKEHRTEIVAALEALMQAVQGVAEDFGKLVSAMSPVADAFKGLVKLVFGDDKDSLKYALEMLVGFTLTRWVAGMLFGIARVAAGFNLLTTAAALAAMGLAAIASDPTRQTAVPTADGILPGMPAQGGPGMQPGDDGGAVTRRGWSAVGGWLLDKLGLGGMKDGRSSSPRSRGFSPARGARIVGEASVVDPHKLEGVHPALRSAVMSAAEGSQYGVRIVSGVRPNSPRLHGQAIAVDVELFDKATGKAIPNYQNPAGAQAYKDFWDRAHTAYVKDHPGGENDMRFGGYFSGPRGKYGAYDFMHGDLGGLLGLPMGGGSWEGGYSPETQRELNIDRLGRLLDKTSLLSSPPLLGGNVSRNASLNQKTDITILGSSDPAGSAAAMRSSQDRVGAELLRNARTAFV